jgi:ABC-type antimicrobial peptide transport system permease subunit
VVSELVGERLQEIGIRIALSAQPGQILFLFLRTGLTWSAIGLAIGLAVSTYAQQWFAGLLFGIKPFDAGTFGIASAGVLAAAVAAVWWPAWRASRIEPQRVLRYE